MLFFRYNPCRNKYLKEYFLCGADVTVIVPKSDVITEYTNMINQ